MNSPGILVRFFIGIKAAAQGATILAVRPKLWLWLIAPILVNLFVLVILGGTLLTLVLRFSKQLHPALTGEQGAQSWWAWSLEWFLFGVGLSLAVLILLLVWKVLELVLFGVAYARITESVERERLRPGEMLRPLSMTQDLVDAVLNAMILIAGFVAIFALNLLPGVGNVLSIVLGILWGAFVQGLDLIGICRALRGDRRWRQIGFCYRYSCETLGLGLIGFIFSFLPLLGPVLVASCAVGAVLIHEDISKRKSSQP